MKHHEEDIMEYHLSNRFWAITWIITKAIIAPMLSLYRLNVDI